uniref:Uncharacterized protein n=1 Tax=Ditylenchus dipsaci TaxID=166011 RepID=A0A915CS12_9BILA
MKQASVLSLGAAFFFAVLALLSSFSSNEVRAVQDKQPFADKTSDLPLELQKDLTMDSDSIISKLGVGKRVEIPFVVMGSNQVLAFEVSQPGDCIADFEWDLFYPNEDENCNLAIKLMDGTGSIIKESKGTVSFGVEKDEALKVTIDGDLIKMNSNDPNPVKCPLRANQWQKKENMYAMNVTLRYISGNCDVQLKFDRSIYKLERKPESKEPFKKGHDQNKTSTASSYLLLYILLPVGVLLLSIVVGIVILVWCKRRQSKKKLMKKDVEAGRAPTVVASTAIQKSKPSKKNSVAEKGSAPAVSRPKEKTCKPPSENKTAVSKNTHELMAELSESASTEKFEEIMLARVAKNEGSQLELLKLNSERKARLREKIKSGAPLTALEQFTKESWDIYARYDHDLQIDKMKYRAKRKKYKKRAKGSKSAESPPYVKSKAVLEYDDEIEAARERYEANVRKEDAQKEKDGIKDKTPSVSTDEVKSEQKDSSPSSSRKHGSKSKENNSSAAPKRKRVSRSKEATTKKKKKGVAH